MTARDTLDPIALLVDAVRDFAVSELQKTGREPVTRLVWLSNPASDVQHCVSVRVDGLMAAASVRPLVHEAARDCWINFTTWMRSREETGAP